MYFLCNCIFLCRLMYFLCNCIFLGRLMYFLCNCIFLNRLMYFLCNCIFLGCLMYFLCNCFFNNTWQVSAALAWLPEGCPEPGSRQCHGLQSCRSSCFWWWSFVHLSLNATGQPPQQYWKSALIPNPFKLCKPVLSQTWRQTHVKTNIFQQLLPTKNPRNVVIKEPHHKIQILQPECVAHRFNGHDAFDASCLSSFMSKAHFDIAWKTTFGPISNDKDN